MATDSLSGLLDPFAVFYTSVVTVDVSFDASIYGHRSPLGI